MRVEESIIRYFELGACLLREKNQEKPLMLRRFAENSLPKAGSAPLVDPARIVLGQLKPALFNLFNSSCGNPFKLVPMKLSVSMASLALILVTNESSVPRRGACVFQNG